MSKKSVGMLPLRFSIPDLGATLEIAVANYNFDGQSRIFLHKPNLVEGFIAKNFVTKTPYGEIDLAQTSFGTLDAYFHGDSNSFIDANSYGIDEKFWPKEINSGFYGLVTGAKLAKNFAELVDSRHLPPKQYEHVKQALFELWR